MICSSSRRPRGVTLIEILVSSALFGLFTGMVATALVLAHRTQDASVLRLDAIRRASVCLELMVRDIEAARYVSDVSMSGATPPAAPGLTPDNLNELQIKRLRKDPSSASFTSTDPVVVGYWFDPGTGNPGDGMVRRVLYDGYTDPLAVFPGEPEDGRILVRDVVDFKVSSYAAGALTFIKADLWVVSVGRDPQGNPIPTPPISTSVAVEPTTPP